LYLPKFSRIIYEAEGFPIPESDSGARANRRIREIITSRDFSQEAKEVLLPVSSWVIGER